MTLAPWAWDVICGDLAFTGLFVTVWCAATPIANYRRRKANTPRGDR